VSKKFFAKKATPEYWARAWEASWEAIYGTAEHLARAEAGLRDTPTWTCLARLLPPRSRVLEAGCGLGLWARALASEGHDVVGLDVSVPTLRRLHAAAPGLALCGGDVLAYPFGDGRFDACLSFGVVEHFEQGPNSALSELRRILRPGGLLFCSVPYLNAVRGALRPWERRREARVAADSDLHFYQYAYSTGEMRGHLETAGFEILEVHPQSAHMFLVGARPFQTLFNLLYRGIEGRVVDWAATRPDSVPREVGPPRGLLRRVGRPLARKLRALVQWEPLCWILGHQVLLVARRPS